MKSYETDTDNNVNRHSSEENQSWLYEDTWALMWAYRDISDRDFKKLLKSEENS